MSVVRYDLNKCIGCKHCVTVCPMDVFRFDEDANKSVIAYPENCQSCGQCYMGCMGSSLEMSYYQAYFTAAAARAAVPDTVTPQFVKECTIAQPEKSAEEAAAKAAAAAEGGEGKGEGAGGSGWSK